MASYEEFQQFADALEKALGADFKGRVVISNDEHNKPLYVGAWVGKVNRGMEITFFPPFSAIPQCVEHVKMCDRNSS